jgi:hypothetical protein
MSYSSAATNQFTPEYFRKAAILYNNSPTDRKQWLQGQLINLQASLINYGKEMNSLMAAGATLDGKNDAAQWMQFIGGVATVIPTVVTQIAGAVVSVAGSILGALEKKKDSKALAQLATRAREIQIEVTAIQTYYESYDLELTKLKYLPLALYGLAAYIIYK